MSLTFHYPITPDLGVWYGGITIFSLLIMIPLIDYGFYTSLGGQSHFRPGVLSD